MSYTKLTDFAAKDALLSGNPSKLLRGTEIGAEFDAIESTMAAAEAVNITAPIIAASTSKTTPVDADVLPILDSAAANILKKVTWVNVKAALKTYFDTLYAAVGAFAASGANNDITSLTALVGNGLLPVGSVIFHGANSAPTGYLKANGALVSRTTYAGLFAVIGTTFGVGNGSTTFALPDLRGEFIRGWDDARGIDSGRTFGTAQADDFESHTHATSAVSMPAYVGSGIADGSGGSTFHPTAAPNTATGGTETRPRNIALLACIKY